MFLKLQNKKSKGQALFIEFIVLFTFFISLLALCLELTRISISWSVMQASVFYGARKAAITATSNNPSEECKNAVYQYLNDHMPLINSSTGKYVSVSAPEIICKNYQKGEPFKVSVTCTFYPFFTKTLPIFPSEVTFTRSTTALYEDT